MVNKLIKVTHEVINRYSKRDMAELIKAEIKYLEQYIEQKSLVLARSDVRKKVYEYAMSTLDGQEMEVEKFKNDYDMLNTLTEALTKEIDSLKEKVKLFKRILEE